MAMLDAGAAMTRLDSGMSGRAAMVRVDSGRRAMAMIARSMAMIAASSRRAMARLDSGMSGCAAMVRVDSGRRAMAMIAASSRRSMAMIAASSCRAMAMLDSGMSGRAAMVRVYSGRRAMAMIAASSRRSMAMIAALSCRAMARLDSGMSGRAAMVRVDFGRRAMAMIAASSHRAMARLDSGMSGCAAMVRVDSGRRAMAMIAASSCRAIAASDRAARFGCLLLPQTPSRWILSQVDPKPGRLFPDRSNSFKSNTIILGFVWDHGNYVICSDSRQVMVNSRCQDKNAIRKKKVVKLRIGNGSGIAKALEEIKKMNGDAGDISKRLCALLNKESWKIDIMVVGYIGRVAKLFLIVETEPKKWVVKEVKEGCIGSGTPYALPVLRRSLHRARDINEKTAAQIALNATSVAIDNDPNCGYPMKCIVFGKIGHNREYKQ
ncbi:hypothetical protein SELMODRAFT_416369 [Selaginella moellendorffii]|uniref:Uncharacterized protein n=1 Tax=Selaginella moellendorffii TaxID=88036 RepID=D8RZ26_SELML|nr:hypothetical protein SELMODRAFT_416369 [Selaginella moellendorffii]